MTFAERQFFEDGGFSINIHDLLGVIIAAYVFVVSRADTPVADNCPVLPRRDNTAAAVHWIHICRGGAGGRFGPLMRLLGVLVIVGGCLFRLGMFRALRRWKWTVSLAGNATLPNLAYAPVDTAFIGWSTTWRWRTIACVPPFRPRPRPRHLCALVSVSVRGVFCIVGTVPEFDGARIIFARRERQPL